MQQQESQKKTTDVTEVSFSESPAENEKLIVSVNKSQGSTNDGSAKPKSEASEEQTKTSVIAPYDRTAAGVMPFSEDAEPHSMKQ